MSPINPKAFLHAWWGTVSTAKSKEVWLMLFHAIAWSIRLIRNCIVFKNMCYDSNQLIEIIKLRLGHWCRAKWPLDWVSMNNFLENPAAFKPSTTRSVTDGVICPRIPDFGSMIFFVDASVRGNPGKAGIGGVLINHVGEQVLSFSNFVGFLDPCLADFLAVSEALSLFKSSMWAISCKLIVASDCKNIVDWFLANEAAPANIRERIVKCVDKYRVVNWCIIHVARNENSRADCLAREGIYKGVNGG